MCFYVCVFVCVLQVRMVYLENVTTHKHNMNHFDTGVTLNVNWLWRPCWFTALWVYTAALVGWNGIVPFLNQTLTSGQTAPFLVEQRYAAKVNIFIIHPSLRSDTGGLLFLRTFWKMYCMVVILRGQLNSFNDPDRTLHQPRSLFKIKACTWRSMSFSISDQSIWEHLRKTKQKKRFLNDLCQLFLLLRVQSSLNVPTFI